MTTYLQAREVAERLRISHSSVLTLIRSGDLPAIDVSTRPVGRRRYLVELSTLEAWEKSRAVIPVAATPRRRKTRPILRRVTEYIT